MLEKDDRLFDSSLYLSIHYPVHIEGIPIVSGGLVRLKAEPIVLNYLLDVLANLPWLWVYSVFKLV